MRPIITCLLMLASTAIAGPEARPTLNASWSMQDTLKSLSAAKVSVDVVLSNGRVYQGIIADVGAAHVVVAKLADRDFYDAVVRIDHISAVETRVRGP